MSLRNNMVITGVCIVVLALCVHGYLHDTNSDPCSYGSNYIICTNENLTSIPVFNLTRFTDVCLTSIYLSDNKLTIIENDAFSQLSSLNCSYTIRLDHNNMSQINVYAFRGIETHIDGLYLETNNLHSLPEALGSIFNLKVLYLNGNPIVSLNSSVMAYIGRSLTYISVSMASFQQWPGELRFLNELRELVIYDIPFQSLDSDAFHGLPHVRYLTINRSHFKKIPNAICALSALYTLDLHGNYLFNESKSEVFEPCSPIIGTPGVGVINYSDNRVDYFPNIFTMFPYVNSLSMYNNSMRFMDDDMFEDNLYVDWLSLNTNQFRRIPSGLNLFKSLRVLLLQRNLIENVDDNDLIGLRSLTNIYLKDNPIQFITNKAFQNNIHLTAVDLSNTFLTTIPAAVTTLPSLRTLNLEANYIECTCDLASLKNWNVSSIQIYGLCYLTNEPIETFIKTYIDAGKC